MSVPVGDDDNDDIFKDSGPALGSDPFALNERTLGAGISLGSRDARADAAKELLEVFDLDMGHGDFIAAVTGVFHRASGAAHTQFFEADLRANRFLFRAESGSPATGGGSFETTIRIRGHVFATIRFEGLPADALGAPLVDAALLSWVADGAAKLIETRLVLAELSRAALERGAA